MKICFVTPYSPREVGGVSKFVTELSRGLHKEGIDSITITKKIENGKQSNLDIIEIDFPKLRFVGGIFFTFKAIRIIIKKRKEIAIINLQRPFIVSQAILAMVSKILGLPVVSTTHGGFPLYRSPIRLAFTKMVEKTTFACSNAVVFVDKRGMELRKYPKSILIENGVDVHHFRFREDLRIKIRESLGIHEKDFVLIFVGHVLSHKGIYELLSAVSKIKVLKDSKLRALFIGTLYDEELPKLRRYIQDLKLSDGIVLLGVKTDVHPYYCAADVFVLPSHDEGLPLALLEAMACGLPAVVSEVGGNPFVIEDFEDGFLVKPSNIEDLTDKIEWCLENPKELKTMGENAEIKARNKYSLERMTGEYIEIFRRISNGD